MDPLSPNSADRPQPAPPAPQLASNALDYSTPSQTAPSGLTASDAALLSVIGRVVAGFVLLLGFASTVLCIYVLYRAIRWLWFTP